MSKRSANKTKNPVNPVAVMTVQQQEIITAHKRFISFSTDPNKRNKFQIVKQRPIGIKQHGTVLLHTRVDNPVLTGRTKPHLTGEGVVFLIQLGGCSKDLLLFILQYIADIDNASFPFNKLVRKQFHDFCSLVGKSHSDNSITQALKDLKAKNAILNIETGSNMINPLLFSCRDEKVRERCMSAYSILLLKKSKDPVSDFYPKYV